MLAAHIRAPVREPAWHVAIELSPSRYIMLRSRSAEKQIVEKILSSVNIVNVFVMFIEKFFFLSDYCILFQPGFSAGISSGVDGLG